MKRPWITFVIIFILTMVAVAIVRPNGNLTFYGFHQDYTFSEGLDLQGGVHLKYIMDLSKVPVAERPEAIQGVKNVMENRINPLGVAEPIIQTSRIGDQAALIIELPGQEDTESAINTIGKTARLTFREEDGAGDFKETNLTGGDLKPNGSAVVFDQTTRAPIINLTFTDEGAKKFSEITTRNLQKSIAIYLDEEAIQVATVNEAITTGQAQISGGFTLPEAQETVRLLNAGALPVPLELKEQRKIGATLGEESIQRSLVAGGVGLLLVAAFMLLYYRFLGLVAVLSLILYTAFSLAIFKLIPVTLTLAGITGFILSIGMAVDANILIFERLKEEMAEGKPLRRAIHDGFDRAWSSIRDSNASSIITALILYNFGASSLIKGFSLTLILGILVSLFTAITVSRTLLYLVLGTRAMPTSTDEVKTEQKTSRLKLKRSERW